MKHIPYVSLREAVFNGHIDDATAHLRRASFHFMCGNLSWGSACIAKANKDFAKAKRAHDFHVADPFDFLKGLLH